MEYLSFTKMHGLGNDFMVVDGVRQSASISPQNVRQWADRYTGVGFDQLLLLESAEKADFRYRIFNADGTEVEQCGNGARCVARFLQDEGLCQQSAISLETRGGVLNVRLEADDTVSVNMGEPQFFLPDATLEANDKQYVFRSVAIGNPHTVLLLDEASQSNIKDLGPQMMSHSAFVNGVNVGFMQVRSPQEIHLTVYERGAGWTRACGSGACAAMAVAFRQGWVEKSVNIWQEGGMLEIQWAGPGHVLWMRGPARVVYKGKLALWV